MGKIKHLKLTHGFYQMVVVGRTQFPIVMLGLDHAAPFVREDAATIFASITNPGQLRVVHLRRFTEDGGDPSIDGWSAFGWHVLSDDEHALCAKGASLEDVTASLLARGCRPMI